MSIQKYVLYLLDGKPELLPVADDNPGARVVLLPDHLSEVGDMDLNRQGLAEELKKSLIREERLREQLRWRKYPEEKPEKDGDYLVIWEGTVGMWAWLDGKWDWNQVAGCEDMSHLITLWLPIPPTQEEK